MTVTENFVNIGRSTEVEHIQFLKDLKQLRFSGQVVWTNTTGQRWIFHLSQGHLVYITDGIHPMRRWRRNLTTYCPRLPAYRVAWQADLASDDAVPSAIGWEYTLLNLWRAQQRITLEQAKCIVFSTLVEALFDVAQAKDVTKQIRHNSSHETPLALIDVEEAIDKTEWRWQAWQNANLADYSPNQAAIIKQPDQLQELCSASFYQTLVQRLNNQHTLYDLAVQKQRDVVEVAISLLPFLQLKWVELVDVSDLPTLISYRRPLTTTAIPIIPTAIAPVSVASRKALIACVDDSSSVRNTMETLLTSAGYQFLGIDNALQAISMLLARKPDLIFLDLVMPDANGYEICEQLRKLSCFRDTPIVILTGNDGYANRLRANFAKASGFLSKPLNADVVLGEIRKHLEQGADKLSVTTL